MAERATPVPIVMPHMGESVVEGKIIRWLKREGDAVRRDETIAEVETAKADVEIPAPADGVLGRILVAEGQTAAVGAEIARVDPQRERAAQPASTAAAPPPPPAPVPAEAPAAAPMAGAEPARPAPGPLAPSPAPVSTEHRRQLTITPVVAKLMERHDLGIEDLQSIEGTGTGGRVTKQDVAAYVLRRGQRARPVGAEPGPAAPRAERAAEEAMPARDRAPSPSPTLERAAERVPMTALRRAIAEHMVRSVRTAAHVTTVAEVDMTTLADFREREKDRFREQEGIGLTYMPFVVRAVCRGLQAFPDLNASLEGDTIVQWREYHVGIAVATQAGLVVPVVRHADRLSFRELAHALHRVAAGGRERKLTPDELSGGTFTISNPGVFGGVLSTPIIHQPQVAILNVQAVRQVPVVRDGALAVGSMMYLCLSYDHRVVDGAAAVQFLQSVRRDLESPLAMFL